MDYQMQIFADTLFSGLVDFYHSPFMLGLKILIGIYLAVVFIDVVLLLILRDVAWHVRVGLKGMDLPLASKRRLKKRWSGVKKRLEGGRIPELKLAIIEADSIAEEMLGGIGYKGANMIEKLEQVEPQHLDDHLEALKNAHEIRNRIINEPDFEIDERLAMAIVGVYENFLKYLEFID